MFTRRYLPSLPALLAIEALDRLGTGAAAAESLGLSQGAVSHQLKGLEDQLGVPLVIREKQRLRLTPAGKDYVREARKALQILSSASLSLRANPTGGSLNLAILPAFGMHWLAPRLARFAQSHPEVTVNLSTRLKPFDFADSRFDAAVHYGRQDWPGADFLSLMEEDILAVAAPTLIAAPLASPDAILTCPLLQLESRPGDWGRWLGHHGVDVPRPGGMMFDQFATMTQAAIHGLGVALLPLFLIERELAEGRLVAVHGGPVRAQGSYWLVWPRQGPPRAPLVSFRNWLANEVAQDAALTPPQGPASIGAHQGGPA